MFEYIMRHNYQGRSQGWLRILLPPPKFVLKIKFNVFNVYCDFLFFLSKNIFNIFLTLLRFVFIDWNITDVPRFQLKNIRKIIVESNVKFYCFKRFDML